MNVGSKNENKFRKEKLPKTLLFRVISEESPLIRKNQRVYCF